MTLNRRTIPILDRRTYRRNIAGFCRKGQRLGADTYDNFQHTLY